MFECSLLLLFVRGPWSVQTHLGAVRHTYISGLCWKISFYGSDYTGEHDPAEVTVEDMEELLVEQSKSTQRMPGLSSSWR